MKKILVILLILFFGNTISFATNISDNDIYTQTECSKTKPCIRTGFSRPRTRFSQPNTRFSQPNKRFAQPKVRCNNTYGQSKYYKTGMNKKYKKNIAQKENTLSKFNKNYSIAHSKKVTCNGITYYNVNNVCR